GLIGIPVLYVIFAPVHQWLARRLPARLSASLVVALGVFLILIPGVSLAGLIVAEARDIASGVIRSPILARLAELRVAEFDVGSQLAALGQKVVSWIGSSAFGLVGTATRLALNLTIAFFGLFYLFISPGKTWEAVRAYIPFSAANAEKLRERFEGVTIATVIGTGLTAFIQGTLVGMGFWLTGLPDAPFWGVVTMVFAILPVVGSGVVWIPGVIALTLDGRTPAAIGLALLGLIVVGNVDNVLRPLVFRRWAQIHPLITLVGAFAGVRYFGLLGLLIGPLAVSYLFEFVRMYHAEYLAADAQTDRRTVDA
ncbi:MAG: AI-2E family transporter, partial [Acidimicrobiales bacterium]